VRWDGGSFHTDACGPPIACPPAMQMARVASYLRSSLWFLPVLMVLAGAALSIGTIALDRRFNYQAVPTSITGGPDAAAEILSTIAASMVGLTALVLTITMVVVQLAMGQFSPRIVQRILQDRPSQLAIGLFVATFVYAILTLRDVTNNGDGTGNVPGIAVVTAYVLVVASIAVLVIYVHHIGRALRVSALIELVGRDTRNLLDRIYPDKGAPLRHEAGSPRLVRATRSGVITEIGYDKLVQEAGRAGCTLELVPALGEFIPAGAPLFRVQGDSHDLNEDSVRDGLILQMERTLDHDVAYGLRLLVDIAQRSLADSPLQDPTTAVQAIDRLHDVLRQLVRRPIPDGRHTDAAGELRLTVPLMTWDAYVRLAFEEIRLAGAGSPQVARRMKAALLDLRSVAPPDRVHALDEQLDLLQSAVESALGHSRDVTLALASDGEGIGVAARSGQ
jgi:uncharacterized membrane protein